MYFMQWHFLIYFSRIIGFVFILASVAKMVFLDEFIKNTLEQLGFFKKSYVIAWLIIVAEFSIGFMLAVGLLTQIFSLLGIVLLTIFSLVAIIAQKIFGKSIECRCFGEVSKSYLSLKTAFRNFTIILLLIPATLTDTPTSLSVTKAMNNSTNLLEILSIVVVPIFFTLLITIVYKANKVTRQWSNEGG